MSRVALIALLGLAACALVRPGVAEADAPDGLEIRTVSYLGGPSNADAVVGAAVQPGGHVVLVANVGEGNAVIVRLDTDGRTVLNQRELTAAVRDLATDGEGNVYLAAGNAGLFRLSAELGRGRQIHRGNITRVDAAKDGSVAAIVGGRAAKIVILGPDGRVRGTANGSHYTEDVCIDSESKTVIYTGFRNARTHDGNKTFPVQIAYLRGVGYDGQAKWSNYGWSTDRESDRFLNKPENNMADTRGYRCSIGGDGKLYAAFEAAGGNHMFRYSPTDITQKSDAMVGGDKYHQFFNSGAEHKTVIGRYDPADGSVERMIGLCGRLDNGKANAVRVKDGQITADADGRVFLSGSAASGLPLTWLPEGTGDYRGGAFLAVLSADFGERLLVTRMTAGGSARAVAVGSANGKTRIVLGGGPTDPAKNPLATHAALKHKPDGHDGHFAVFDLD